MFAGTIVNKKPYWSVKPSRTILFVLALLTCFSSIAAHIHVGKVAEEYRGTLAVLDHTFDLTLTLGLSVVLLCFGFSVAKRFRLVFASTAEEISFALFLGVGVGGFSVLFLGLLGLLRIWPIVALFALYTAMSVQQLPALYRIINRGVRSATLTRETKVITALFLSLTTIFFLRAATPPHVYDEAIYHLPVVRQYVEHGRVFASYDNSLGNVPFLIHMLYAVCLLAGSDIAAKLFSLTLAVATALALYGFCARYLTRRVGIIAMFAFFGAGMVVEVSVSTRIDVSLAGMLFLATYAMVNYLETSHRGWLWASALLAGFSLGIKHSAGLWLLFVGIMYLVERLIRKRERFLADLKLGLAYMLVAAAIASPWYIKNFVWFHNPVYPFFTGELVDFGAQSIRYFNLDDERKLDAQFDLVRKEVPEVVKTEEAVLSQAIHSRVERHPMRVWQYFTQPNTYLMAEPRSYPNYLFLILPLLLFLTRPKWIVWLLVLSICFFLAVTWTSWIARYLLPLYPPLTIVSAYTFDAISDRLGKTVAFARKLPVYAIAAALSTVVAVCAASMSERNALGYIIGAVSRREFMLTVPYYRPIDFINHQTPPGARIMAVGAQMTYDIHRNYVPDESWFTTKWRRLLVRNSSLEEVNQDLKRQGFTHILFSPSLFSYAALMGIQGTGGTDLISSKGNLASEEARRLGPDYPLLRNWATFTLYRMKFLETVYKDEDGYEVYRIR